MDEDEGRDRMRVEERCARACVRGKDRQDQEKHIEGEEKGQRQWLRLLIKQRWFGGCFYWFCFRLP